MTTTATTSHVGVVGNLTDDPELRFSQAGKPWCRARLSVKPYVPGADVQPEPEFYDVVAFGSLAENACEVLHRGSRVVVVGRVEEDRWTGKDGHERITNKLIADAIGPDLRFTGDRPSAQTGASRPAVPAGDDYEEPF